MSGLYAIMALCLLIFIQDVCSDLYCNKYKQTWQSARQTCEHSNGRFLPFHTGLGQTFVDLTIRGNVSMWTGDYAVKSDSVHPAGVTLCTFQYWSADLVHHPTVYADCLSEKKYICWNKLGTNVDVHTGIFSEIVCPTDRFTLADIQRFKDDIIPGYYWLIDTVNVYVADITTGTFIRPSPSLCGAYSNDAGKYFEDCDVHKYSLCYLNGTTVNGEMFDRNCFKDELSSKLNSQSLNTSAVSTKIDGFSSRSTTVSKPKTTLSKIKQATPSGHGPTLKSSITYQNDTLENKMKKSTNIGLVVGLPVGLICVAVILGIFITIYILRRKNTNRSNTQTSTSPNILSLEPGKEGCYEDLRITNQQVYENDYSQLDIEINQNN